MRFALVRQLTAVVPAPGRGALRRSRAMGGGLFGSFEIAAGSKLTRPSIRNPAGHQDAFEARPGTIRSTRHRRARLTCITTIWCRSRRTRSVITDLLDHFAIVSSGVKLIKNHLSPPIRSKPPRPSVWLSSSPFHA